jgi:hypothetical protein
MNRVEYVGHPIDSEGIHFTRTKLDSIAKFEEPKTMFDENHFLGLANYFRDHVPNFSVLAIPLQNLVIGYTKSMRNRKVKLEGPALAAFLRYFTERGRDTHPLLKPFFSKSTA